MANPDSATVSTGGTVTVLASSATSVLTNDTDADLPGDTLTAVLVSGPANAAASGFTLNGNGTFSYHHNGGTSTTDSFTYRVSDGVHLSNTTTVTITISPVGIIAVGADAVPTSQPAVKVYDATTKALKFTIQPSQTYAPRSTVGAASGHRRRQRRRHA